jgi:hypothetical protein
MADESGDRLAPQAEAGGHGRIADCNLPGISNASGGERANSEGRLILRLNWYSQLSLAPKKSYKPKGACGSDFLKASHASNPIHASTPPKTPRNNSVWADHILVTNRLPNTDAR